MDDRPDETLVREALAGHGEAFAELVRRYQDYAYGTAIGMLSDFDQARDVVQEAFLCAFRDLAKLREPALFGRWLYGIVKNTARRVLRKSARERRAPVASGAMSEPVDPSPRPDQMLEDAEAREMVRRALERLGQKDREALSLFYVDGLSYANIAGFLGVTATAVQGRLQRGRAKLRKELTMVAGSLKSNAPDEAFAERLARAIQVFRVKGPPTNNVRSPWEDQWLAQTREILRSGADGFRMDVALSKSGPARLRWLAALHFGLRRDSRGAEHLARLMQDGNARVRKTAVRWYGDLIHPTEPDRARSLARPADSVPDAIDQVIPRLDDVNFRVRMAAVSVLACYARLAAPEVGQALGHAMADPKHKVRHAAARALGVACPGCGHRASN